MITVVTKTGGNYPFLSQQYCKIGHYIADAVAVRGSFTWSTDDVPTLQK